MTYQVQVRSLCPDWLARKKSDNPQADINSHKDSCKQSNCGYSNRDYYIYTYVDAREIIGLLAPPTQKEEVAVSTAKRTRAKAAAIPEPVDYAAPMEDLLGDDEDLLGGTSAPAELIEDLL